MTTIMDLIPILPAAAFKVKSCCSVCGELLFIFATHTDNEFFYSCCVTKNCAGAALGGYTRLYPYLRVRFTKVLSVC